MELTNREGLTFKEWVCAAGVAVYSYEDVMPYSKSDTIYLPPPMKRNDPKLIDMVDHRTRCKPWVPYRRSRRYYSPKVRAAWKVGEDPTEWRARA